MLMQANTEAAPRKEDNSVMESVEEFFSLKKSFREPFHPLLLNYCESLSKALFQKNSAAYPGLMALAFWLRKANILVLNDHFESLMRPGRRLVPRGIVFHVPPSNVDTMFVYSWVLSLLAGNANIIRLPSKKNEEAEILLQEIQDLLKLPEFALIARNNRFVSYGHEEEITGAISAKADVRIIWGGDQTVKKIRQIPLKPSAKEIVFCDRTSFAAIEARHYLQGTQEQRMNAALQLFNDLYPYDQAACSSPRGIFWVGSAKEISEGSRDLYQKLKEAIEKKGHEIPTGAFLQKQSFAYGQPLRMPVKSVQFICNELTVVELDGFDPGCRREHCGFGLIYHIPLENLSELSRYIVQKDQTLTYFGFSKEELAGLVNHLQGSGLGRIVPFGQALSFSHIWDGYDLLHELTRWIIVEPQSAQRSQREEKKTLP